MELDKTLKEIENHIYSLHDPYAMFNQENILSCIKHLADKNLDLEQRLANLEELVNKHNLY